MKIVDLNVLMYATNAASHHHDVAKQWLDDVMTSSTTVGLPTLVTIGFVRLTTNHRVLERPLTAMQATDIVERWLGRPNVAVPQPTPRHYTVLAELLSATGTGGNLVPDAHLAALAVEHGAELWSFDHDFARFPGLKWRHPGSDR